MLLIVIPVECGWIHPVKEHHQQLFVSHLKYVHGSLNIVHQISANQVRVEEHLDSLSVTSWSRANLFLYVGIEKIKQGSISHKRSTSSWVSCLSAYLIIGRVLLRSSSVSNHGASHSRHSLKHSFSPKSINLFHFYYREAMRCAHLEGKLDSPEAASCKSGKLPILLLTR